MCGMLVAPTAKTLIADFVNGHSGAARTGLIAAAETAQHHLHAAQTPCSSTPLHQLSSAIDAVDMDAPLGDLPKALDELGPLWLRHAVWYHHPSYASHLNCPVAGAAVAGDAIATAVNTAVESWDQAGPAALIEMRLLEWLSERLGWKPNVRSSHPSPSPCSLPTDEAPAARSSRAPGALSPSTDQPLADARTATPSVRGVFTSGGTQSNLQALFIAREKALEHPQLAGCNHWERMSRLRIITSRSTHYSVARSVRLLGLGPDALVTAASNPNRPATMDPEDVQRQVRELEDAGCVVAALVATAGTTDRGAIDPLEALARITRLHGIHLHVDAAYGGVLLLSPTQRHRLRGIEHADSVTVDFHKGFFQPVACSCLALRNPEDLRHVTHHAAYLNPEGADAVNLADFSLQTTRRFDALKLWVMLRTHGPEAIGEAFDRCCDLARETARLVEDAPGLRLLAQPELSTVLFVPAAPQVGVESAHASPGGAKELGAERDVVERVRDTLMDRGEALIAVTTIDGRSCFKLTILDPSRSAADLARVIDRVSETLRELQESAARPTNPAERVASADSG